MTTPTVPETSTASNSNEFDQPHWRIVARGYDTERWFGEGQAVGSGGISMPQPTRLSVGQYYYRFASSASPRDVQLGGGWWIEFEAFKTIDQFAAKQGYRIKDAARLMLGLPYDWTKVDLLVKALLRVSLRAYTGLGKAAQGGVGKADKKSKWIPTQHTQVRQLYIPGLYVKGRKEQLWETAFQQPPSIRALR